MDHVESTLTSEADLFLEVEAAFEGRWEPMRLIASSPVRALFLARDVVLKREIALRIHFALGRRRSWFVRETELLAVLDHPSIRTVYHAGTRGDWAYRVSKWIEGESLEDAVRRAARPIPAVLRLARDLISVLEYAHSQDIVLRRIVPANVMLDRVGKAIITDLRFANRCLEFADRDAAGEAFLAPETWHGHAGEPASDIYAVGAVLYYAVTGSPPASDPAKIRPPRELREACPQALQRVVMRSLQADPRNRYLTATDMSADLMSELGDYEASVASPSVAHPDDDSVGWEKMLRRALGDEYELLDELGRGGFGSVYRVRDLRLERIVALKVLHPYLTADATVVERFRREAQLAAQLHHPHIVAVHGTGARAGLIWYTMAHVDGVSLARWVDLHGPLPLMRLLVLLNEALDALAHAHGQRVVHRDLKPENMLIDTKTGGLRITDFGLAIALHGDRWGGASSHSGTPEYASPEQLLGEKVDLRSDLYSLSAVAFFALAGKPPFGGGSVESILARQASGILPDIREVRRDVPEAVLQVLRRGAARSPDQRYASADEYANALRSAMMRWKLSPATWIRRLLGGGRA